MVNPRQQSIKRQLGVALRRFRERANLTQRGAADAQYLSVSTIIRMENGSGPVRHSDLEAMLGLYGVQDQADRDRLAEWVTIALQSSPWSQYKDIHSPEALTLFESEAAARIIYKFESQLVPGLLQTEPYARAVLESLGVENIEKHVACRRARQELLSQEQRPALQFVIGEAVLSRAVGGRQVMIDQVDHLTNLARQQGLSIRIVPFSAGAHRKMGAAFSVLQFDDEPDELLYLENPDGHVIERDDSDRISDYLQTFFELSDLGSPPEEFAETAARILSGWSDPIP